MSQNLKGRWALVTGASAGFGKSIAENLAAAGINVVVTARRKDRLETLCRDLSSRYGVQTLPLAFDISNRVEVEKALAANSSTIQKISILVNNAGLARGVEAVQDANLDDWDVMIDTNVKGLLYVTRLVLPSLLKNAPGHIVNIGSVAGRWTYPGGAVYSATKFAVRALSDSLRMDLMGKNIRVSNIEPGMAETEFSDVRLGDSEKAKAIYRGMTPLKPVDIAETVLWCLDRPAHVNIQELVIFPTDQVGVGPGYTYRR